MRFLLHAGSEFQFDLRFPCTALRDRAAKTATFSHLSALRARNCLIVLGEVRYRGDYLDTRANITQLIEAHRDGDDGAYDRAVELLYEELHGLAHHQLARFHGNATLQTTAVVNEAYLKLRESSANAVDRRHFLGVAAKAMRHVVIDYARKRSAEKRGGDLVHVQYDDADAAVAAQADEILLIEEALRRLSGVSERLVKVFECKFFAGLDDDETAAALDLSKRTAQRDWMKARALLADILSQDQ